MEKERKSRFKEERLQKTMSFIESYREEKGYPPSIKEVSEAIGVQSTSLSTYYIQILVDKGYLVKETNVARSLKPVRPYDGGVVEQIVAAENKEKSVISIPVTAEISGETVLDLDSQNNLFESPRYVEIAVETLPTIEDVKKYKAVRVSDDSFVENSLLKGDCIVVIETKSIEDAGTYIVCDDEKGTTSFCKCDSKDVSIQPLRVIGKAVLMIRTV